MAIIKCPECGHEVSDAADKCPNCGVAIAGNVKVCPDCGRVVLKNAEVCPSCGCKLMTESQNVTSGAGGSQARQQGKGDSYSNTDPYAPRKKKNGKGVIIGTVIAVVVIVAGVLAYYFINNAKNAREEAEAYEETIASNDTALYNQYLVNFPEGEHADEVKSKLAKLTGEMKDWNDACVNNTRGAFVTFMSNHPGSAYEQACKDKIDSLDFQDAFMANTAEALQMYIANHPDGKYVAEAAQAQKNIDATKVKPAEASQVKSVCGEFFNALGTQDDATLTSTVSVVMDNFLNKHSATHADVTNFAHKLAASKSSMSFSMNNDYKIRKSLDETGQAAYDVTFSVDEISVNVGESEEAMTTYYVTAHLNSEMKISSLNMRRVTTQDNE